MAIVTTQQYVFLDALADALGAIDERRLFEDERGYQGELLRELAIRFEEGCFPGQPIVQQEYQKTLPMHGIRIRPDIIVHIPFERGGLADRRQGNFIAIELKRDARERAARQAFGNLQAMKEALAYPLPCLIRPKPLRCQPLQPPHQASPSHRAALSGLQAIGPCPTQPIPDPSAPTQTDAKYIGFNVGGFLQVAVSEAPRYDHAVAHLRGGALQIHPTR